MQKKWQAWTFVDFGQASSGQDGRAGGGGGDATDCTGVGFGAIRVGRFLPLEAARNSKTVACACIRGACIQYDPKVIVGAKTLGRKGDAYYGS